MGRITLNLEEALSILKSSNASADLKVIAAATIAFFEVNEHADAISNETRAIVLKLAHMVAREIYDAQEDGNDD